MYCKNCGSEIDEAAAFCVKCGFRKNAGVSYCANCGADVTPGAAVCTKCGAPMFGSASSAPLNAAFCSHCGQPVPPGAAVCTKCGFAIPQSASLAATAKSKWLVLILALLLGGLGVHNFYLGYTGKGLTQLLVSVLLSWTIIAPIGVAIWALVEGIMAVSGSLVDATGMPLKDGF